ncbi:hypothetical protein HS5_03020 [Acidianus sp. HS-5]|nr:hypothetical protein HS5_03020 [Acidianus sp. HS-5]
MGSLYYSVEYPFFSIPEFKIAENVNDNNTKLPIQVTLVKPYETKVRHSNEKGMEKDNEEYSEGVLFIIPDSNNDIEKLKVAYDTVLLLLYNDSPAPKGWSLFSMDLASRILFLVLPIAEFIIEDESEISFYIIPIVQFIENEEYYIRKTFSLSLLFIPKNAIGDPVLNSDKHLELPDFDIKGKISGDLINFLKSFPNILKLKRKDKRRSYKFFEKLSYYINKKNVNTEHLIHYLSKILENTNNLEVEIKDLYALILLALVFIFSEKIDEIEKQPKMWDTLVDLVESCYIRHVQIAENPGKCKPRLADEEIIFKLAYEEKPDKDWLRYLHKILSEKTRTYNTFDLRRDFFDYDIDRELSFVNEYTVYSIMNVRDYEKGVEVYSALNTWAIFYFIISSLSMLLASLYSVYNVIAYEKSEKILHIENELIDDLYEFYDLDFAPYLKQIFRKLRRVFGGDADYQALREKLELTKDNSIRELEERRRELEEQRNKILLTATLLGVIAVPLVLYFNTHNLTNSLITGIILGLSAVITYIFVVYLLPVLVLFRQKISRL